MGNRRPRHLRRSLCPHEAGVVHACQVRSEGRHGDRADRDVCKRERPRDVAGRHSAGRQVLHWAVPGAVGGRVPARCVSISCRSMQYRPDFVLVSPASVDVLLPLFAAIPSVDTRAALTPLLALCLAPLCFPTSLAGTSAIYSSWISIVTFVAWLIARAYAHARNIHPTNPAAESLGILWQGISKCQFPYAQATN